MLYSSEITILELSNEENYWQFEYVFEPGFAVIVAAHSLCPTFS